MPHTRHCTHCPPPPPFGVLWVPRSERQGRKLSKSKCSSVVPEAPFGLDKDVQRRVDVLLQVPPPLYKLRKSPKSIRSLRLL